jgi:hypothetical protein
LVSYLGRKESFSKNYGAKGIYMICDWCGKKYSEASQNKEVYHVLEGYASTPVICDDCYRNLEKTKSPLSSKRIQKPQSGT